MNYNDFEIFFKDVYNYVKNTNQLAFFDKITHDLSSETDAWGDKIRYYTLFAKFDDGRVFSMVITPSNFSTTRKLSALCISSKIDFPTLINKQLLPFL